MRLFIGIELPENVRCVLAAAMDFLSEAFPGKYVRDDTLHITLAFPGETKEDGLNIIRSAMDDAAEDIPAFEISLGAPGFFGKIENAILYCGTRPSPELESAADVVRKSLAERGVAFDPKPFFSHITLARHARLTPEAFDRKIDPICFTARAITLFHSHRVNDILTYAPIYRAALGAERDL